MKASGAGTKVAVPGTARAFIRLPPQPWPKAETNLEITDHAPS